MTAAETVRREPTIDLLRVLAIVGVVGGHWLITAPVAASDGSGLHVQSPLADLPQLAPVSWVLQTLALFFFAGGYAAAASARRSRERRAAVSTVSAVSAVSTRRGHVGWLRSRVGGLLYPLAQLGLFWVVTLGVLAVAGVPAQTLTVAATLVVSPLWFLGVYLVLSALTPVVRLLHRRFGPAAALGSIAVVVVADLVRYGPWEAPLPAVAVQVAAAAAIVFGWLAPFQLGYAVAEGRLGGRRTAFGLLAVGLVAALLLVRYAGYPASMVGVTGADRSNLNPPSLVAVVLGLAQIGLFLLLRPALARLLDRARAVAAVARVNAVALGVFLWHQSALLVVVLCFGRSDGSGANGLVGAPDGFGWVLDRLVWLPVFLGVLLALLALFVLPRARKAGTDRGQVRVVPDGERELVDR